ncbi:MAG: RluA family pseudouridine synthase [Planctomycetota bacterium]
MGLFEKDRDLTEAPDEVRLVVDAMSFRTKARGFTMRLDRFLGHHLKWRSRSSVQELVRGGYVEVDAARPEAPDGTGERRVETRPGARLLHGSRVYVRIPDSYRALLTGETSDELDVLWEDDDALAVEKPPLVAIHPSGRHMTDTLIQRVHRRYRDEIESGRMLPRLCHRLDRETSGVVLVGKRPATHATLTTQFEDRRVEKHYLAVLDGEPPQLSGSIDAPIRLSATSPIELEMTTAADGLPCRTDWETLEVAGGRSLVRLQIHTGRQHQIRVHMKALGAPLVGDKLYGPDREIFLRAAAGELTDWDREQLVIDRHALHSAHLGFRAVRGDAWTEVESGLPLDLREAFPELVGDRGE